MHPKDRVREAFALDFAGLNRSEIARLIGVPRRTVSMWLSAGDLERVVSGPMRSNDEPCRPEGCELVARQDSASYAYLLGLYLGDGCLTKGRREVYKLRIVQDARYRDLIHECRQTITRVGRRPPGLVERTGCVEIVSYSKHWLCLFPQHGAGRKHERAIDLVGWQKDHVERAPLAFLRGLIHSDGCRVANRVVVSGRRYVYARYFFSNRSPDIRRLFSEACSVVGIASTTSGWTVSVARRADVALLDAHGCRKI